MTEAPDAQPVQPKQRFYSTKTLLFGEPDTNTRYIRDSVDDSLIVTMNAERRPWTPVMEILLHRLLKYTSVMDLTMRLKIVGAMECHDRTDPKTPTNDQSGQAQSRSETDRC